MKCTKTIQIFLKEFDVDDYYEADTRIVSACPIHEGDNPSAFNFNTDESDDFYGLWFCNTKQCHEKYGNDSIALIRCLMEKKLQRECSFSEVVEYIEKLTSGVEVHLKKASSDDTVNDEILKRVKRSKSASDFTSKDVRKRLKIPADFYICRGFCPNALDEFDVGLCEDPQSEMHQRVVFPVYDKDDKYLVGCSGRTVVNNDRKWKNKKGFNKANYLYNYGKSFDQIYDSSTIILVEGQGDVIKLWSAGIKNAVGIFGCSLSDAQEFLIQSTGALNIVTLFDNDDSGDKCRQKVTSGMKMQFNIKHLMVPEHFNDVGEMSIEQIKNEFGDLL